MVSAKPTYLSRIPRNTDTSVADVGARLLGMSLFPQGLNVAGVLEARKTSRKRSGEPSRKPSGERLYNEVGVLMARRATKTTSIWSVLLGRCATIPRYRVVTTAQDGTRAGEKIREHMELLEANGFEESGAGTLFWSNGKERIKFANGSVLWVVAPKPGAFRSAAADAILFDEAGELTPELGRSLMAGALPLMDTREAPQVIVTGTPGMGRAGLLWDTLEDGRKEKFGTGIVDYSIRDDEESTLLSDPDDPESPRVLNVKVLRRVHPGIGTLTTLARMRQRFEKMQLLEFEREYLCRFPFDSVSSAIDPQTWALAAGDTLERPERLGIAYDVSFDSTSASIAYAWRLPDGTAVIEVAEHRPGTSWLPNTAHRASKLHPRCAIAYDPIGANLDPASALERMKPKPRMSRSSLVEVVAATQRLVEALRDGRLLHFDQADLNAAVENATWRNAGRSGRAFGTRVPGAAAINPLVAAALALWEYDKKGERRSMGMVI